MPSSHQRHISHNINMHSFLLLSHSSELLFSEVDVLRVNILGDVCGELRTAFRWAFRLSSFEAFTNPNSLHTAQCVFECVHLYVCVCTFICVCVCLSVCVCMCVYRACQAPMACRCLGRRLNCEVQRLPRPSWLKKACNANTNSCARI